MFTKLCTKQELLFTYVQQHICIFQLWYSSHYLVENVTLKNVTLTIAPPTGNTRSFGDQDEV